MNRNQFSSPVISYSPAEVRYPKQFREYAFNGGYIHTFSDLVMSSEYKAKNGEAKVIHVRNPTFDEMENLI